MDTTNKAAEKSPIRIVFAVGALLFGSMLLWQGVRSVLNRNNGVARTPNGVVQLDVMRTPQERQKGLSGRQSLAEDKGMLFVFDTASKQNCFWMKDMQFAIDMVWLNDKQEVVTVHSNVAPSTYPESFCPSSDAVYGLELSAGNAQKLGIFEETSVQLNY